MENEVITHAPDNIDKKPAKRFQQALVCGLASSTVITLAWFLFSKTLKPVAIAITCTVVVLMAAEALVWFILRNKSKIVKALFSIFALILNIILCFSVLVYNLAPSMLFYPHFDEESYIKLQSYENAEQLSFQADGRIISGWFLHNAGKSAPLIIYYGGNGENASRYILSLLNNQRVLSTFEGCNIVSLDYPGYGKTTGTPSEASLKQYGLDAFDALSKRDDVDPKSIIIFGYSIGTGVSNYVASQRNAAGMILMAPYADGYDLYNGMMNVFHGPARALVAFRMESVKFAENISVKPLIFASNSDEMVRYESSVRLSESYPAGCSFITVEGIDHNSFWTSDSVPENITAYLNEVKAK